MSGHSKFANIKHRKEKNDSIRGKVFTRIGRELAIAVKSGGPDPATNGKLRDVVVKARASNMSNDTIERSIKKAAGDLSAVDYEQIYYEGYGPSGVAVIVEALTDNRNRAAANIRSAFTKGGGNMGASGCVSFMFDDRGVIMVEGTPADEDSFMELALEAGARSCLTSTLSLFAGVYFDYGLNNSSKDSRNRFIKYDRDNPRDFSVNSVASLESDPLRLMAVGLKLRLSIKK